MYFNVLEKAISTVTPTSADTSTLATSISADASRSSSSTISNVTASSVFSIIITCLTRKFKNVKLNALFSKLVDYSV